jgi:prepilin-type N-terminal cleavage/methylation domain-containing protein
MNSSGSQKGFTLLEVLIALAILLIGIGTVMQIMPISLLYARSAAEQTVASQAADSVIGQLRQMGADALFYDEVPRDLMNFDKAAGFYGYTTTIQRVPGTEENFLQKVTFTVILPSNKQKQFVTYISKQ